jgi:hypothetical protein
MKTAVIITLTAVAAGAGVFAGLVAALAPNGWLG